VAVLVLLLLVICVSTLVFTLVCIPAFRRLVRRDLGEGHNNVSGAIFGVGGTIYAVFLAFLVIVVWEKHEDARRNVADEASLLTTLYRAGSAMDPNAGAQLRALIRRYTRAVIVDEWPIQAKVGGAAETARAAGLAMYRLLGGLSPEVRRNDDAIIETQLGLISQIQSDRNKRTLQAEESISPVIWAVAVANGFIVVVMSFFLYPDRDWPHVVLCSLLATMIAMLLYVIFIFEKPFGGLMPLAPEAFEHSLQVYDSVDRAMLAPRPL
jgi:hypothetical protein